MKDSGKISSEYSSDLYSILAPLTLLFCIFEAKIHSFTDFRKNSKAIYAFY